MEPRKSRRRFFLFSLFLLLMGGVILFTPLGKELTPEKLHAFGKKLSLSALFPVLYPLIIAVAVWAMMPAFPFVIASGVLFGPAAGAAISFPGVALGTIMAFMSGRTFLHNFVQRHLARSPRLVRLDTLTRHNGFLFALLARLILIVPWNMFNYAASLTSIRFRDYVAGTLPGILPEIIVMTLIGDAIADWKSSPGKIILPILLNLLILAVALTVRKKMRKKEPS